MKSAPAYICNCIKCNYIIRVRCEDKKYATSKGRKTIPGEKVAHRMLDRAVHGHYMWSAIDLPN